MKKGLMMTSTLIKVKLVVMKNTLTASTNTKMGSFFLHLMFTRNDNEDEKVELALRLADQSCSRHMWCVLNNDDIEDDRKGPLNHHALSCHVMAMIYHQALLMWPTGIASEEDIHTATDNDNDQKGG